MMQIDMILSQVTGADALGVVPTTWNPSDKGNRVSLSNGNLTVHSVCTGDNLASYQSSLVRSVSSVDALTESGLYWELRCDDSDTGEAFGVATTAWNGRYNSVGFWGVRRTTDSTIVKCGSSSGLDVPISTDVPLPDKAVGDVFMFAVKAGHLHIGLNGRWFNNSSPETNSGALWADVTGMVYTAVACHDSLGDTNVTANFGASPFAYLVPTGFSAGFGAAF